MSNRKKSLSIKDINKEEDADLLIDKPLVVDAIYVLDRYTNIYRIYEKYSEFYLKILFQDCLMVLDTLGFLVETYENKGNIDQEEKIIEQTKIFPNLLDKTTNVISEYENMLKSIEEINIQLDNINKNANENMSKHIKTLKDKINILGKNFKDIIKTLILFNNQINNCILYSKNINNYKIILNDIKNIKSKLK